MTTWGATRADGSYASVFFHRDWNTWAIQYVSAEGMRRGGLSGTAYSTCGTREQGIERLKAEGYANGY